jgi:crotonobetainyl-CoA:carnitine CoA-transferase CaiB-like acyl-CoA transferase
VASSGATFLKENLRQKRPGGARLEKPKKISEYEFCQVERPEMAKDPGFSSFQKRTSMENEEALQDLLEEWSLRYPVDEVIERVQAAISKKEGRGAAVVTGKVSQPVEVLQEQNCWDRGVFQKVQDPTYGELTVQGPKWKMSETPPRLKWICRPVGAITSSST